MVKYPTKTVLLILQKAIGDGSWSVNTLFMCKLPRVWLYQGAPVKNLTLAERYLMQFITSNRTDLPLKCFLSRSAPKLILLKCIPILKLTFHMHSHSITSNMTATHFAEHYVAFNYEGTLFVIWLRSDVSVNKVNKVVQMSVAGFHPTSRVLHLSVIPKNIPFLHSFIKLSLNLTKGDNILIQASWSVWSKIKAHPFIQVKLKQMSKREQLFQIRTRHKPVLSNLKNKSGRRSSVVELKASIQVPSRIRWTFSETSWVG